MQRDASGKGRQGDQQMHGEVAAARCHPHPQKGWLVVVASVATAGTVLAGRRNQKSHLHCIGAGDSSGLWLLHASP